MDDYINKIKAIDEHIEARLEQSKANGVRKLIGAGALVLASVVAATTLMKPSYHEASTIQQMVHFYSERPDALYAERLPELKAESLHSLAQGNNRFQYKDPFVNGEVVHVFYAREMHHDPLLTTPRFAMNDSTDVNEFGNEWGSVQFDMRSDIDHLFHNVDTTLNIVRFDPSQAQALAMNMQDFSAQTVDYNLVNQWILLHEITHGHPLQNRMSRDAQERVADIASILSVAKLNTSTKENDVVQLANHVISMRNRDSEGLHSTNGGLEMVTEYLKTNFEDVKKLPMTSIVPIAFQVDKNIDMLIENAHVTNQDPVVTVKDAIQKMVDSINNPNNSADFKEKMSVLKEKSTDMSM